MLKNSYECNNKLNYPVLNGKSKIQDSGKKFLMTGSLFGELSEYTKSESKSYSALEAR